MTQAEAFDILKLGNNVFLTGAAGSGKTYLLNQYIAYLKQYSIGVAVTASTGIAATHLGGITVHSWAGIGIKERFNDHDLKDLLNRKYLQERFASTKVLIIDEISMLHAYQLDLVNEVCRAFKRNSAPFGGMQVIMCGDFFQLPPVSKNGVPAQWVHESQSWRELDTKVCYLTEQYRQSDDAFIQLLNDVRNNALTEASKASLYERYHKPVQTEQVLTKLYTHNIDVDAINHMQLGLIKDAEREYEMTAVGRPGLIELLKKSCLAPERLILKKGALVMFVKNNFEKGYVNGTLGTVIDFDDNAYPVVETVSGATVTALPASWTIEEDGEVEAEISQLPLRLAWAITIHKSQGMSLDAAEIDLSKSFASGMGYVALSRVRTLSGIKLVGLSDRAFEIDPMVREIDNKLQEASEGVVLDLSGIKKRERARRQALFLQSIT